MASLTQKFDKSLRVRLIIFLILISTFTLVVGTWFIYREIHQRIDADIESDAVLVSRFINHTAMATMDRKILQHLLMEVYKETSRIKLMLVAENKNNYVIAATIPEWIGLHVKDLPDEHLSSELSQNLKTGSDTQHVESDDDELTIITSLDQHLSSHSSYSGDQNPIQTGSLQNEIVLADHKIDLRQGDAVEKNTDQDVSSFNLMTETTTVPMMIDEPAKIRITIDKNSNLPDQWENLSDFPYSSGRPLPTPRDISRGSIVVVFDRIPAMMGANNTFLLQGGTITFVIFILAIVIYFRVTSMFLKPVEKLTEALRAQIGGGRDDKATRISKDEIGDLAENFNTIISNSQEENKRLKKNMTDVIREEFDRWNLTKTEKEIALLLIKGFSMQEIGEMRNIKEKSVRQQATRLYTKARVSSRHELSSYFIEDLLEPKIG